jgi:hypothetical protein
MDASAVGFVHLRSPALQDTAVVSFLRHLHSVNQPRVGKFVQFAVNKHPGLDID